MRGWDNFEGSYCLPPNDFGGIGARGAQKFTPAHPAPVVKRSKENLITVCPTQIAGPRGQCVPEMVRWKRMPRLGLRP
jgi:hypothetical protein